MSHQDPNAIPGPPVEQAELQEEIERTRADLAETVDELTARLDVKTRLHDRVVEVKHDAAERLGGQRRPLIAVAAGVLVAAVTIVVVRRRRQGGR